MVSIHIKLLLFSIVIILSCSPHKIYKYPCWKNKVKDSKEISQERLYFLNDDCLLLKEYIKKDHAKINFDEDYTMISISEKLRSYLLSSNISLFSTDCFDTISDRDSFFMHKIHFNENDFGHFEVAISRANCNMESSCIYVTYDYIYDGKNGFWNN